MLFRGIINNISDCFFDLVPCPAKKHAASIRLLGQRRTKKGSLLFRLA